MHHEAGCMLNMTKRPFRLEKKQKKALHGSLWGRVLLTANLIYFIPCV